jgi:hypothetical protein
LTGRAHWESTGVKGAVAFSFALLQPRRTQSAAGPLASLFSLLHTSESADRSLSLTERNSNMAAAGTQCGKLVCGTGADACTSSLTCHCVGGFYGPTCSGIFYVDQSSSFWAYFSLELILFVVLTGCGVALAAFYFGTYLRSKLKGGTDSAAFQATLLH